MANAILSADALADLAAATDSAAHEPSVPLVAVGHTPISGHPTSSVWSTGGGGLSAWDPANRAEPICEVRTPPSAWPRVAALAFVATTLLGGVALSVVPW